MSFSWSDKKTVLYAAKCELDVDTYTKHESVRSIFYFTKFNKNFEIDCPIHFEL